MESDSSSSPQQQVTGNSHRRRSALWVIFLVWLRQLFLLSLRLFIRFQWWAIRHLRNLTKCLVLHSARLLVTHLQSDSASASASVSPPIVLSSDPEISKYNDYLQLYKAALGGDWEGATKFMDEHRVPPTQKITEQWETALHVAVGTGKSRIFVQKMIRKMTATEVADLKNKAGETALSVAAIVGNTHAAKLLVAKNPQLPNVPNKKDNVPLVDAALYGQRETLEYLLTVTEDVEPSPFNGKSGVLLLNLVTDCGFYDLAQYLIGKYPGILSSASKETPSALSILAEKPSAFPSGTDFNFWQRLVYCIPMKKKKFTLNGKEVEVEVEAPAAETSHIHKSDGTITVVLDGIVEKLAIVLPIIKHIREKKLKHQQARKLVKRLCKKIIDTNDLEASNGSLAKSMFKKPLLSAAKLGISEIVEEIVLSFPSAIWVHDHEGHNIFHLAVLHRREKVFNLLHQMTDHKKFHVQQLDKKNNTILHLVAHLSPQNRLNLVSGCPAFQMQSELQWYKEVKKYVPPSYINRKNGEGISPREVFTKSHMNLLKDGENWMRNTAQSCTTAATLVAGVMFAAAITVPGGNNQEKGFPIFSKRFFFFIFSISNAASLFTSIASLSMFLFILTSRYAESDFLFDLPLKLIVGFVALFFSITFMLAAFSSTLFLVLGQGTARIAIAVSAPTVLIVSLFIWQVPLIYNMIMSMRVKGKFKKQSEVILY